MWTATNIAENLHPVQQRIAECATAPQVTLIAVAKTFPAEAVRAAHAAGISDIGENYLQEAEEKIRTCADLPLVWHFIGRLQKNKLNRIARRFDWVHSVDSLAHAEHLSHARGQGGGAPLNVFLQLNISGEESKGGVQPKGAADIAAQIAALPHLHLRGLMVLPAQADEAAQLKTFTRVAALQKEINAKADFALDSLSMGMSADYPQALRAGATHIRIGSALFGLREKKGAPQ